MMPRSAAAVPLWSLIGDPLVRDAFRRAGLDYGQAFVVPRDPPRTLDGGAAEQLPEREFNP